MRIVNREHGEICRKQKNGSLHVLRRVRFHVCRTDAGRVCCVLAVLFLLIFGGAGCGIQKAGSQKVRDLDYTVVSEQEIPEELQSEIESRKSEDFKMTYMRDNDLYLVRGFGMQQTGGYSIQVQELYLAENAIYFETDLIGPENSAEVEKAVSYPYMVVKTERLEENVVFE